MFQKGDWVTIRYGEYAGRYGKISAVNRDRTYRVIPYRKDADPGSMINMDGSGLTLLPPCLISREELRRLARAELIYRDIADHVFPIFHIRAEEPYELTAEDIVEALKNINRYPDCLERFREWFWLIQNILYQDLGIAERYVQNVFSDAPESEEELFSTVYYLTETLYWKLEERYLFRENAARYIVRFEEENPMPDDHWHLEEKAYKAVCEDIASRVRTFRINQEMPAKERLYSQSQKRHIMNSYEDEEVLKDASPAERALFRRCVLDLESQGDTQAMRILAFGYLEGSAAFRQSYRQAEKYLLRLYKKSGDPLAASSLGFLYYHGLAGNRQGPDYAKAFRYFSYGALAGVDESLYSLGDMLVHGNGTVRNIDMGINLIADGYRDTLQRFGSGEYDNRFADYAFHMGRICKEKLILGMGLRDACKFLMEADFAIRKRMEINAFPGDEALKERIREELEAVRKEYAPEDGKNVLKADFPIYISHMFEDKFPIQVTIEKKQADYYLKMKRFRLIPGIEPDILVAFPELSYVGLASELSFRLEEPGVIRTPDTADTFLAEGFAKNEHTGALEFYAGGECVAAVEAKWFVIDVTAEKLMRKLEQLKKKRKGKKGDRT